MDLNWERACLCKLSEGDQGAFRELFDAYFSKVRTFVVRMVKSEIVAEEIAQDIFVKLWLLRVKLTEVRSLNAYLFRMARNASINYLKYNTSKQFDLSDLEVVDEQTPDDLYIAQEEALLVQLLVENMPEKRREVYRMSREQGLSNDEIAQRLQISKKTVENHMNLALKEIRNVLLLISFIFWAGRL